MKKLTLLVTGILIMLLLYAVNTKEFGCRYLQFKYNGRPFPLQSMIADSCERCGFQITKQFANEGQYANVCLHSDVDLDGKLDLVVGTTTASNHLSLSQVGYILKDGVNVFAFPVEGVLGIEDNKTGIVIQRGLKDFPLCCETGYIQSSYTFKDGVLNETKREEFPVRK